MKKTIIILLTAYCINAVFAQHSLILDNPEVEYNRAKELFQLQKYALAIRNFEVFLSKNRTIPPGQFQEIEFYLAASAFELKNSDASEKLEIYITKYPYTPFYSQTQFMLGSIEFEKKAFLKAQKHFSEIDEKKLDNKSRLDFIFMNGFVELDNKNYIQAAFFFKKLKEMHSRYDLSSSYYYAYCQYCLGNYDTALPEFIKIENNTTYQQIVPYYIIQIYYAQKKFGSLTEKAEELLKNNPNNSNNGEIYRIMGEIAYKKNDYKKTVDYMEKYEKQNPQVLRNDMYITGLSYFQLKNYKNAIQYLSKVTTLVDEMSENAYLHLGNSFIKTNDLTNARMAYESAIKTKFNEKIRKEALFNYALTTYQTNTAFGEAISAFEQFLSEYPQSEYTDKAYDYLSAVYLTTKSYEAAYKSIIKIENPNAQMRETREYLLYQLGTEAFTLKDLPAAIDYFSQSLASSNKGKYSAESYFWRAECYYRTKKYDMSTNDLKAFFNSPYAKNSTNYITAYYSLGYSYFNTKQYSSALDNFLKYTNIEKSSGNSSYADAMNRIGDCYFYNRNFILAESYYSRAIQLNPKTADYSLFQSAYILGLQKNYQEKISKLEQLLKTYTQSEYTDNALYEIGRAYLLDNNNNSAIRAYKRLLDKQPKSDLARKASLEIGMIYFNENKFEEAISAYKDVITRYPGSEESFTALESLEDVYVEINDIASYLAYTKTLGKSIRTITASREDSLSFVAIEKQFLSGKLTQTTSTLNSFLSKYCPGSKYCETAHYYLADSYYRLNDKANALKEYQFLLTNSRYAEEASMKSAEITFDDKNYSLALQYFKTLLNQAHNNSNKNIAKLGILRCSNFLNDFTSTLAISNDIISDTNSEEDVKNEAKFNRAKAYMATNQINLAISDLKVLTGDTRTYIGAESNFLLAQAYFNINDFNSCETQVMDFAKKNTPHQFWLAKSFVLLSDVYIQQHNDFQAKQYLLSLQRNYTTIDEIQPMIQDRLEEIAEREKKTIIN